MNCKQENYPLKEATNQRISSWYVSGIIRSVFCKPMGAVCLPTRTNFHLSSTKFLCGRATTLLKVENMKEILDKRHNSPGL